MSSTSIYLLAVFLTLCAEVSSGGVGPPSSKKFGVCPRNDAICHGKKPQNYCNGDEHCPGPQKCCPGPCGQTCTPPKEVKPGSCPPKYVAYFSAFDECQKDADCTGPRKCCQGDDGLKCKDPQQDKPKSCPPPEAFNCPKLAVYSCNYDSECPKAQKCCFKNCCLTCMEPK